MPLYEFQCAKCMHVFDEFLTVSNRDTPIDKPCPSCGESGSIGKVFGTPPIADSVKLGRIKPPGAFRDILQRIHEKTPGSVLNVDRNIG